MNMQTGTQPELFTPPVYPLVLAAVALWVNYRPQPPPVASGTLKPPNLLRQR